MIKCFVRLSLGEKRRGVWAMTGENRGTFFHGDRDEMQLPRYRLSDFMEPDKFLYPIKEISVTEALDELEGWSEAQDTLRSMVNKIKALNN